MYFYTKNVLITPCGGNIHFQFKQFNHIAYSQLASNFKATQSNGEKAKFTHESATYQGADFWFTKIQSR